MIKRLAGPFFLALFSTTTFAQELGGHPRLFVAPSDVDTLKSWAISSNPVYEQGLKKLALEGVRLMDEGIVPQQDPGGSAYSAYYTEGFAHVLAFMSLIEADPQKKSDYEARAKSLLMHVIDQADKGIIPSGQESNYTADEQKYRRHNFSHSDRARWIGLAFPLTVDWIYHTFSAQEKVKIRRVFLRWIEKNMTAYPHANYFRSGPDLFPDPSNYNDPVWLELDDPDRKALRYAMNNYFMMLIRNSVMMAMSFDAADDKADPAINGDYDGHLRSYREKLIHTWFFMTDYAFRTENNGGLSAEGIEYMPSMGYPLHLLLSLHTAGYVPDGLSESGVAWGDKVSIDSNPHWARTVPAVLNSLAPESFVLPGRDGTYYPMSWYGDGEHYFAPELMRVFGPLGVYCRRTGKQEFLQAIRWIEAEAAPGGSATFLSRVSSKEEMNSSILYFMLYDPASATAAANGTFPHPGGLFDSEMFSPGAGRIMSRTSWGADATWLNYTLGWTGIDHQHGDGNMFDFYRKGEWITKERTGYGNIAASSDYKNTLTIKSNTDGLNLGTISNLHARRGSQYVLSNTAGNPELLALTLGNEKYLFVTGDATNLYNYDAGSIYTPLVTNVKHASRSLLWIKPDVIVVYDRVRTDYAGFKRFWLTLPDATPELNAGQRTLAAETPGGQYLLVKSLLPEAASMSIVTSDEDLHIEPYLAVYDPMQTQNDEYLQPTRLMVEAEGNPLDTYFLHVVQGADSPSETLSSYSLEIAGMQAVRIDTTLVLFQKDLANPALLETLPLLAGIKQYFITGLEPTRGYHAEVSADTTSVHFSNGTDTYTDRGGVLVYRPDGVNVVNGAAVDPVNQIAMFPNPASAVINLHFAKPQQNLSLELFNLNGMKVNQLTFSADGVAVTAQLPAVPPGIYLLVIRSKDIQVKKLLVVSGQ